MINSILQQFIPQNFSAILNQFVTLLFECKHSPSEKKRGKYTYTQAPQIFMLHLGIVKFVLWCIIHATKQNIIIIRTNVIVKKPVIVLLQTLYPINALAKKELFDIFHNNQNICVLFCIYVVHLRYMWNIYGIMFNGFYTTWN